MSRKRVLAISNPKNRKNSLAQLGKAGDCRVGHHERSLEQPYLLPHPAKDGGDLSSMKTAGVSEAYG
ncbi:hypothetical protein [Candidatus Nitrospira allomarina]|uniref:Uncharacterized protein n=1 Tax=Candidatus Nitrospira allomarina TaxID=3020900 RepID=A0AA96K0U5_9BACT|nr:hypothetical protein [Candidatus Nitrospira allomarina]WNM60044.1 hypothetical protein PP769_09890 [Candidatus Nitrospira allomarina]